MSQAETEKYMNPSVTDGFMTPVETEKFSNDYFRFAEKTHLIGADYSPVFLLDNFTCQGKCCEDTKTGEWHVYLEIGCNTKHIDTKPTREEAMALLWSRREEGTAFDIGF
ncbi:hypothetical protein AB6D66_01385 [Vibrio pomeroyi]|uniref:Uncharacterized protein n=1 Tax=Vibrio pomeroyi TaxID=198832 RepID=A0ABV4MRJ2_9VIBR|nr:hypothetical protein [Vibrio atlanticus]MCZ4310223.1 hypothetical protein [Vibrio atlanticus]